MTSPGRAQMDDADPTYACCRNGSVRTLDMSRVRGRGARYAVASGSACWLIPNGSYVVSSLTVSHASRENTTRISHVCAISETVYKYDIIFVDTVGVQECVVGCIPGACR